MTHAVAALALLLATSSATLAADADMQRDPIPEAMPSAFNWTGASLGLQAGYVWSDARTTDPFANYIPFDPDGFSAGLYAGYDHQFGNGIVLGIDADIGFSTAEGTSIAFTPAGAPLPITTGTAEIEWQGAIRARLGYAMGRFLPYLAGGFAAARVHHAIDVAGIAVVSGSDVYTGYTVGAGLDYALTENITLRGEYRFSDLGDRDFTTLLPLNIEVQTSDVRLGLAYRF